MDRAAKQLGLNTAWQPDVSFPNAVCGFRVDSMARINTGRYLKRLADLAVEAGVTIFERSMVESSSSSEPKCLTVGDGSVFDHLIYTVHCNFTGSLETLCRDASISVVYACAARVKNPLEDALFWDNPTHTTSEDWKAMIRIW
ncbi:MAG: hypothetical protein R3C05_05480 [Pirellulaceae bacterium]